MQTWFLLQSIDNLDAMELRWLNLLPLGSTVLWHEDTPREELWYVLGTCMWGLAVAKVRYVKEHDGLCFGFPATNVEHRMLQIRTLESWRVYHTKARPPLQCRQLPALEFLKVGKPESLLKASASGGFRKLTDSHLGALCDYIGVEGAKPKTVGGKVTALLQHIFPKIAPDEIDEIIAKRKGVKKSNHTVYLPSMENVLLEGMSAEDASELRKEASEQKKQTRGLASSSGTSASETARKNVRQKAVPLKDGVPVYLPDLQALLPKVPGCTASFETSWHHRVKAYYPVQTPPYSHSASYRDDRSMKEACIEVLHWVWKHHESSTGAVCPWRLE